MKEFFTKPEKQMIMYVLYINKNIDSDNLINLNDIYEDYQRPKNKSPKEIFFSPILEYIIDLLPLNCKNKLISFQDNDILVSPSLAFLYLNEIDSENFIKITSRLESKHYLNADAIILEIILERIKDNSENYSKKFDDFMMQKEDYSYLMQLIEEYENFIYLMQGNNSMDKNMNFLI